MTKTRFAVLAAAVALASPALAAETYNFDRAHTAVGFQVRHIFTNVSGRFTDFAGTIQVDRARPESSSVEFTIQATSIDTSEPRRDQHLRSADFFDVANHPTISFKSTSLKANGKDAWLVTGDLTLRGVTKQVTLPVTLLGEGKDPYGQREDGTRDLAHAQPQGLRPGVEQDPRDGRDAGRRRGQGPDRDRGEQGQAGGAGQNNKLRAERSPIHFTRTRPAATGRGWGRSRAAGRPAAASRSPPSLRPHAPPRGTPWRVLSARPTPRERRRPHRGCR